jgi:hypothetical protein
MSDQGDGTSARSEEEQAPHRKRFVRFLFPRGMTAREMVAEIYRVHEEEQKRRADAAGMRKE